MPDPKQDRQQTPTPLEIIEDSLQKQIDAEVRALTDPLERAQQLRLLIERTPDTDLERRDQLATEVRQALGESATGDPRTEGWAIRTQLNVRLDLARLAPADTSQSAVRAALEVIAALDAGVHRIAGLLELQDIVKHHAE